MDDTGQSSTLDEVCNLAVTATTRNGESPLSLNIFNSSNVTGGDVDLGTPNVEYGGPGIGDGGNSSAGLYANDVPQGNVLIIQEPAVDPSIPNDHSEGGCMVFEFYQPVELLDIGVLDADEPVKITVRLVVSLTSALVILVPATVGRAMHAFYRFWS